MSCALRRLRGEKRRGDGAAAIQVRLRRQKARGRFISMAVLLEGTARLRAMRAGRRNGRPAVRSTSRPAWRKTISSARRRAWPRLCVVMTMRVPAACDLADDALDLGGGAGIEARGGLVEEEDLGPQRPGAREREALLLAAGEHARRRGRRGARGRRARALRERAARALGLGARRSPRARSRCWRARSGAASPGAGTPWPARGRAPRRPRDRARRWAR